MKNTIQFSIHSLLVHYFWSTIPKHEAFPGVVDIPSETILEKN